MVAIDDLKRLLRRHSRTKDPRKRGDLEVLILDAAAEMFRDAWLSDLDAVRLLVAFATAE